ncbi:MAG: small multi-drug export protein [Alphaproteobacteria bacterium]|nr:small multi-drug export protein [Alphaproteobacteria bacterium]MCB9688142.1 small multi-drug export protein [Alphaproteobacteria bacterium]
MSLLWVVLLCFTPTLELRAGIPYALLVEHWNPWMGGAVGIAANTALAPVVWLFLDKVMHLFLHIEPIRKVYDWAAARSVNKLEPYVHKYGVLGLALFIGVPFPGTGVYSGCLAAWILKFKFREYMLASFLGCAIAGVLVTLAVASGNGAFHFLYKDMGAS